MKESTAFKLVKDELDRATEQHGEFNSAHEGYAVLLEEVDELWAEVKHGNVAHKQTSEAVQVAAMAIRFLIDICDESTATEHERKVQAHIESPPPPPRYVGDSSWGGYSG